MTQAQAYRMPSFNDLLSKLKAIEADGVSEIAEGLAAAYGETATQLDTAKGELRSTKKAATESAGKVEKLTAELEKAGKGTDDQVKALQAERDKAIADLEATQGEHRNYRISTQLADKLGISDAARRDAAMKVLGVPDGVDLDESGTLVGADEHVAAFKEAHGYFWGEPAGAQGNGGGSQAGDPKPGGGGKQLSPEQAALAEGAALANLVFGTGEAAQQHGA